MFMRFKCGYTLGYDLPFAGYNLRHKTHVKTTSAASRAVRHTL